LEESKNNLLLLLLSSPTACTLLLLKFKTLSMSQLEPGGQSEASAQGTSATELADGLADDEAATGLADGLPDGLAEGASVVAGAAQTPVPSMMILPPLVPSNVLDVSALVTQHKV
jgi:hypothetical protein